MAKRLTAKTIRYAMKQLEKGRSASEVATDLGVMPRHIRSLWAEFRETGSVHVPRSPGRPALPPPSQEEVQLVLDAYKLEEVGVLRTAISLRRAGHDISYQRVYRIMKENGLVVPSKAKSRKRKWERYERKHSNSMWHTDWHAMKDPRMKGLHLITFLDDASRCVTGVGLFSQATSENAVMVLRQAIRQFGAPATILSDNGSCFVGTRGKTPKGSWTPTAFEKELLGRGIELINSRPYHPQTNGNLERFHRTIEEEIGPTRACLSTSSTTTRGGSTFRWTYPTTKHHSKRSRPRRLQKKSGPRTSTGWRRSQMTSGHNFRILHTPAHM